MSTETRKVVITSFGDTSKLSVVKTTIPDPPASHVQVRIICSGFNGGDINMRMGRYPMQKKAPLTPGYCLVGRVPKNALSTEVENNKTLFSGSRNFWDNIEN